MSQLPANSPVGTQLANTAVSMLYNSVPHPPAAYLGPEYVFRQADGGMNNLHEPDMGRAGTRYARSVQSKKCIPASSLPDPGLIFDTLLKARDVCCLPVLPPCHLLTQFVQRVDHKGGNSSLAFAFASLVTHSLFRTNPFDWTTNDTSSYLDLSPLYGHSTSKHLPHLPTSSP
jgi:linoleate 10R-lipoxygenase